MSSITPQPKMAELIVVVAFDPDEEGAAARIRAGPQISEDRAVRVANGPADKHAGFIAWRPYHDGFESGRRAPALRAADVLIRRYAITASEMLNAGAERVEGGCCRQQIEEGFQ
jgi:hypothetical protein